MGKAVISAVMTPEQLQDDDAIAYGNNPNGSIADIAGITNSRALCLPHPERV